MSLRQKLLLSTIFTAIMAILGGMVSDLLYPWIVGGSRIDLWGFSAIVFPFLLTVFFQYKILVFDTNEEKFFNQMMFEMAVDHEEKVAKKQASASASRLKVELDNEIVKFAKIGDIESAKSLAELKREV